MNVPGARAGKRVALEILGWLLLVVGLAALFLPGPGLLSMFAGLALLSQQYEWARRWVEPVKLRAFKAAAEGVETWPRITLSLLGVALLAACGVLWIRSPATPAWWSFPESWWLPGGLWTGITQVASAAIALGLIAFSYRRYHGHPGAVADLTRQIKENGEERRNRADSGSGDPVR